MRLIDADRLMDSLRGNVLVEVTQSLEEAIMEQPTAEKCVPRKVTSNGYHYICPACGSVISIRQKHKFCHDCGQELGWKD